MDSRVALWESLSAPRARALRCAIRERRARVCTLAMEGSILALLERHGSLAYEQIASHLHERPDAVRNSLAELRDRGLVAVLSVGELVGNRTNAAAYWRLTDAGRATLARSRPS